MGIDGAKTIAANTDAKHLSMVKAHHKILMGRELTRGLGAGGYPEIGKQAAMEAKNELRGALQGCDLLFLTCGLGGGTGTGAAPVVASIAKELDSIVISAVTLPFKLEGARVGKAEDGLEKLKEACDTVIAIENQKLLEVAGNRPIKEAFGVADNLIATMIKGISETISQPSLVNLDYADVRTIMKAGGVATVGIGISDTKNRAHEAVTQALNNPLLDVEYTDATGALIQIIGGEDMRLEEVNEIGETVSKNMNPEALVMWGARILPEYENRIQVITIITGVKSPNIGGKSERAIVDKRATKLMTNELGIRVLG
jgi:cell division protein FtsZ